MLAILSISDARKFVDAVKKTEIGDHDFQTMLF